MKKRTISAVVAALTMVSSAVSASAEEIGFADDTALSFDKLGGYTSGMSCLDGGVTEILSYDYINHKAWVVNGMAGTLEILDLSELDKESVVTSISIDVGAIAEVAVDDFTYGDMTSVSINSETGIAAVALQHYEYDKNGYIALLSVDGELLAMLEAGCQPDMVTFTPDGTKILSANEGEPRNGYGESVTDPCGSVTVIELNHDSVADSRCTNVGFELFDERRDELASDGVIFVKDALPSADFEPEYIAADNSKAYITLQESNALAVLDLDNLSYDGIYPLGFKDLSLVENAVDLIKDSTYAPLTYDSAIGVYMPDGISIYNDGNETYILTANEGDAREWGTDGNAYCNEIKADIIASDGTVAEGIRVLDNTVTDGIPEGKTALYGGRSFSIYRADENGLTQVFDSGSQLEAITAEFAPEYFNCSNDDSDIDSRSQKKGPEPESVVIGTVGDRTYAFVGLERFGGIAAYDITVPENTSFAGYVNTRDFTEEMELSESDSHFESDISPEGLCFVDAEHSPTGTPLLLAAFEVSGTVAAYSVEEFADNLIEIEEIPETSENPDTGIKTVNAVSLSAAAASLMLIAASKKVKKAHR